MSAPERRSPPPSARERIEMRRATRRPSRRRLLLLVAGLALLVAVAAVALVLRRADQTLATIQQRDPRQRVSVPTSVARSGVPVPTGASRASASQGDLSGALPNGLRQPINILLIGVDKRPTNEDGVRSDTLILVHLEPQAKWASMLSIPRDSVVQIPHLGQAKINAAYAHGYMNAAEIYGAGTEPDAGGAALAAETVEQFLGVSVDYTAQVDFRGFAQLVDTVGGVLIDVERPLLDAEYPTDDYGVERVYIPAGLQVLNGRNALIYARSRHGSNDFDRSRRQQQVLRALLDQIKARGLLENASLLPQLADVVAKNARTTLPVRDLGMLNGLATLARGLDGSRIAQLSINPNDVAIDAEDGSDIYWNKGDVAALVARWLAGPQAVAGEQARVQVLNGAAVEGIAGQVSGFLRGKGFALSDPATAPRVYEHTTIIDYSGRPQVRQKLADALGVEPRYIQAKPAADAPPPAYQTDLIVIVGQDYKDWWKEP